MIYLLSITAVVAVALMLPMHARVLDFTPFRRRRHPAAPAGAPVTPAVASDGPILKQLVWAQADPWETNASYPTLAAIDQARGESHQPFANDPGAAALEQQARKLVDEAWSELVWLTGLIDQARFDALCAALDSTRSLSGSDIELVVVRELGVKNPRNAR